MNDKRIVTYDRDGNVLHTVVHQELGFIAKILMRVVYILVVLLIAIAYWAGYLTHILVASHRI